MSKTLLIAMLGSMVTVFCHLPTLGISQQGAQNQALKSEDEAKLSDEIMPMLTLSKTLWLGSDRWKKIIQEDGATADTLLEKVLGCAQSVAQFNLENKKGIITIHTTLETDSFKDENNKNRLFLRKNDQPEIQVDANEHTKCTYTLLPLYTPKDNGKFKAVATRIRATCVTTMQSKPFQESLAKTLDILNP